jgi:hypothetical protein
MARISVARSLHDLGIALWCGGSLMGATGLNGAASSLDDPAQRGRAVNEGWQRWAPISAAAIGAHLVGGALIVRENRGRIAAQKGVAGWTSAKTALTAGAVAVTAVTGWYSGSVWKNGDVPVAGATTPNALTPDDTAAALKKLQLLQWATPALTAAIIISSATMGEQQRPAEVIKGALGRGVQAAKHPAVAVSALKETL